MGAHYLATGFGWNLIRDIHAQFQYAFMQHAYIAGAIVAIVAGVVGYFVVLRSLSFAGHALSHIGFAGATGAVALGVNPIYGLLVFTVGGAIGMGALGKRIYGRDVVIGIVLAWMLGLGVLFLSLYSGYATEAYALLFGEILGINQTDVVVTLVAGVVTLAAIAIMFRPLLFASVDSDVAEARGVPVRLLSILFMGVGLAISVSRSGPGGGSITDFRPAGHAPGDCRTAYRQSGQGHRPLRVTRPAFYLGGTFCIVLSAVSGQFFHHDAGFCYLPRGAVLDISAGGFYQIIPRVT